MKRPEPIELENNLGPDVNGKVQRVPWLAYDKDEMDLYLAEKDKEAKRYKRKRCLDMVDICEWAADDFDEALEHAWSTSGQEEYCKKRDFYNKWATIWRKIAEKLKEK